VLAWIAKSEPKNRKNALELAGFGNTALAPVQVSGKAKTENRP